MRAHVGVKGATEFGMSDTPGWHIVGDWFDE